MWKSFYYINDSMELTKITHFSNYTFILKNSKVLQLLAPLFLVLGAASPGKDNGTIILSLLRIAYSLFL